MLSPRSIQAASPAPFKHESKVVEPLQRSYWLVCVFAEDHSFHKRQAYQAQQPLFRPVPYGMGLRRLWGGTTSVRT